MPEVKKTHTYKEYPEDSKQKLQAMFAETKSTMVALDELDTLLINTVSPSEDSLKEWARKATGYANYMRKKFKRLSAASINEKDARYMEIKLECNSLGVPFVDSPTKIEAEGFIAPLRVIRDIFEAYVISAQNIVSTCRMHFYGAQQEQNGVEV